MISAQEQTTVLQASINTNLALSPDYKATVQAIPKVKATEDSSITELAILILSQEWPLPMRTIHWKMGREYGKLVSFQATHKALKKLVQKQILTKQDLHYELNTQWLKQQTNFNLKTMQAYLAKKQENNQLVEKNSTKRIN